MTREEALEGINDKLKDLKYYATEMGEVLKSTNYFIDELERQAKKEEPKLKAWHVRDEYSFNCLMEELDLRFGFAPFGENYIYEKNHGGERYYNWTGDFEDIKDTHDIIEYHKEPPKLYAKIKGWELNARGALYWAFDEGINRLFTSDNNWAFNYSQKIMTKEEWSKLGITDENADFEEIKGN